MMQIKVIHSQQNIADRVSAIAKDIAAAKYNSLVLLIILRGGIFLGTDLARALWHEHVGIELDFMSISIYDDAGERQPTNMRLKYQADVRYKDVLIVDDSYGTGHTYEIIRYMLAQDGANRIDIAVIHNLLDRVPFRIGKPTYALFNTNEKEYFRIGYGEDVDDRLREVPFIGDYPEGWATLERYK